MSGGTGSSHAKREGAWMRTMRFRFLISPSPASSRLQRARAGVICCIEVIGVGGSWIGANSLANCQEYFNTAPTAVLRRMCSIRKRSLASNAALPRAAARRRTSAPDVARRRPPSRPGWSHGFGNPADLRRHPRAASRRRAWFFSSWGRAGDGNVVTSFTVWLDRDGCAVRLDQNNRLADSAAARHVVRGR